MERPRLPNPHTGSDWDEYVRKDQEWNRWNEADKARREEARALAAQSAIAVLRSRGVSLVVDDYAESVNVVIDGTEYEIRSSDLRDD